MSPALRRILTDSVAIEVLIGRRMQILGILWANCRSERIRQCAPRMVDFWMSLHEATLHSANPGEGILKFVLCLGDVRGTADAYLMNRKDRQKLTTRDVLCKQHMRNAL